jgi:hypothetical protein
LNKNFSPGGRAMKFNQHRFSLWASRRSGFALLFVILTISGMFWSQNASGQRTAVLKLTLAQIEQLVSSKVPDSTLSTQIKKRGLAFAPTPAIIESLRASGAGPLTLAGIEARFPKPAQSTATKHAAASRENVVKSHIEHGEPIHSCAIIGMQDYSNRVTSEASSWIQLNRGEEHNNYSFAYDGSLFYSGKMLTNNIPVTGTGDNHWIYAQSIVLSPKSPSGRFSILQACEDPNLGGLCWALFVVDHSSLHIERTFGGKYGPDRRVAWIRGDDEYAVLRDTDEGQTNFYRIHLPTGESTECSAVRSVASSLDVVPSTQPTATPPASQSSQPAVAKPVDSRPSLAETMQSIRDEMKEQGQLDYVSTTSNQDRPAVTSRMNVHSVDDNVLADQEACTLHVDITQNDSLLTFLGGKTLAQGTYDQRVQIASTVSFKDVEGIAVESRQVSQNRSFAALGHPELSATVEPSVFVVQLSSSKPVFSAHLSTTIGSGAPQVSDNTGAVTEFLFRDEERANRVAKAMRHVVELCGDNKGTF